MKLDFVKKILFEKKAKTICDYNKNDDLNRRDAVLKMYQKIAYENDNYFLYDPYNQICPGKKCKFFDNNNLPIIYDGSHMTNEFAIKLSNHFDNWFRKIYFRKNLFKLLLYYSLINFFPITSNLYPIFNSVTSYIS